MSVVSFAGLTQPQQSVSTDIRQNNWCIMYEFCSLSIPWWITVATPVVLYLSLHLSFSSPFFHLAGGLSPWSSFPPTRPTWRPSWPSSGWRFPLSLQTIWPTRRTSSMARSTAGAPWPSLWCGSGCAWVWNLGIIICVLLSVLNICLCSCLDWLTP